MFKSRGKNKQTLVCKVLKQPNRVLLLVAVSSKSNLRVTWNLVSCFLYKVLSFMLSVQSQQCACIALTQYLSQDISLIGN